MLYKYMCKSLSGSLVGGLFLVSVTRRLCISTTVMHLHGLHISQCHIWLGLAQNLCMASVCRVNVAVVPRTTRPYLLHHHFLREG